MPHTVSTQLDKGKAKEYNRDHNNCFPKSINKKDHIDPFGIHESWIDETAKDDYERIFGESTRGYNARQMRKDRPRTEVAYEMVVQISNKYNAPDAKTSYKIFRESSSPDGRSATPTLPSFLVSFLLDICFDLFPIYDIHTYIFTFI